MTYTSRWPSPPTGPPASWGLCIPEDLSVVGYDDHQLAVLVGPGLTTLAWDADAIVEAAVGQLAASGTQSAPFRPELIVRGSTNVPGRPA